MLWPFTTSARIRSQPFLAKPEFQKLKYIFNIQYSELRENSVFKARASCSKILNDKKYFNTVKNFRATLFFKASASCSNILNGKKYIQYSGKFHGKLCFPGQGENNFNTVYSASNQGSDFWGICPQIRILNIFWGKSGELTNLGIF